ncbi:MAG: ABC transporter ATP-binding protein [Clostridium sp.]
MSKLSLKNIYKIYSENVLAVDDFNLEIEDKEFIVFVGPSGCGKSTTLRMIAGLEEITKGELYIGDKLVNDVEPKDRDIAMVFQNYALYPHMTVYENMEFALKLRSVPTETRKQKVLDAAKILDIEHLLERKPKALSGGQRQRVALGRAIVREPKVFLMDEPLSNLDAKLRVQMRTEISKLHKELKTTFIYVTHDQTEAMTMGTRIVVMKGGIIQQVDTPQNIYNNPKNKFVASFIGSPQMNLLDGVIVEKLGSIYIDINGELIKINNEKAEKLKKNNYIGKEVSLGIRPEHISTSLTGEGIDNLSIKGKVETVELLGAESYIYAKCGENNIVIRVNGASTAKYDDNITLTLNTSKTHIFDKETEEQI